MNIGEFCKNDGSVFRPADWRKLQALKILDERKLAHSQIKLEVEVFVRVTENSKSEALIVFRGTDFEEQEDWSSNLRWFNRLFSIKLDQYDEVRLLVPRLIDEIEKSDATVDTFCSRPFAGWRFGAACRLLIA